MMFISKLPFFTLYPEALRKGAILVSISSYLKTGKKYIMINIGNLKVKGLIHIASIVYTHIYIYILVLTKMPRVKIFNTKCKYILRDNLARPYILKISDYRYIKFKSKYDNLFKQTFLYTISL